MYTKTILTPELGNHTLATGRHSEATLSGYDLTIKAPGGVRLLTLTVNEGIRGIQNGMVDVSADGTITFTQWDG